MQEGGDDGDDGCYLRKILRGIGNPLTQPCIFWLLEPPLYHEPKLGAKLVSSFKGETRFLPLWHLLDTAS